MQYSCPSGRLILATFSRLALISSRKTCTDAVTCRVDQRASSTLVTGAWQLTTIVMRQVGSRENSKKVKRISHSADFSICMVRVCMVRVMVIR